MGTGLFGKYKVEKTDGSEVDPKARYLVLRLDTDPHARTAAFVYALCVEGEKAIFAKELAAAVEAMGGKSHKVSLGIQNEICGQPVGPFEVILEPQGSGYLLKTVPFQGGKDQDGYPVRIHIQTEEFTAIAPATGMPDVAQVEIDYIPNGLVLDLGPFRHYLDSFRNERIGQEEITARIYDDVRKAIGTAELQVMTVYNTRAGVDVACKRGSLGTESEEKGEKT